MSDESHAEGFARRLRELKGDRSVKELGVAWAIPTTTLQAWLTRGTLPSMPQLDKLARAAGVNERWLATGEGARDRNEFEATLDLMSLASRHAQLIASAAGGTSDDVVRKLQNVIAEALMPKFAEYNAAALLEHGVAEASATYGGGVGEYKFVPRLDVRASAGRGRGVVASQTGALAFRRDWIDAVLRMGSESLVTLSVDGDSMAPTFDDGDVVLVNRDRTDVASGAVYVFTVGEEAFLKRLQRKPGEPLLALSDNRSYDPFPLPEDARIEGRVVWRGGRV